MPKTECCITGCRTRGGHRFPFSNPKLLKAWAEAVNRAGKKRGQIWKPSKTSVVCHTHFLESDYIQLTTYGDIPLRRRLKPEAVPSVFAYKEKKQTIAAQNRQRSADKRQARRVAQDEARSCAIEIVGDEVVIEMEPEEIPQNAVAQEESLCDNSTTAAIKAKPSTQDIGIQCILTFRTTAIEYANDDEYFHYLTGLYSYEHFRFVISTLGPGAYQLNYYNGAEPDLYIEDQFFLAMIRLRRHKTIFELHHMFKVKEEDVTNIFVTIINFMAFQWDEIKWWPSAGLVQYFSPTDFKEKYPRTRVTIDGTECPMQKPKQPVAQQASFSTYKNRNTAKVLVGCTPGGLISYVSEAYCGSASDRQIVERSALPGMCDSGDDILADKGFNVQDIFAYYNVTINIPTFFRKQNKIKCATVMTDRKCASKRVHIERLIGLGKTFHILKVPFNNTESAMASQILKVCYYLCNFRDGIVPSNA